MAFVNSFSHVRYGKCLWQLNSHETLEHVTGKKICDKQVLFKLIHPCLLKNRAVAALENYVGPVGLFALSCRPSWILGAHS